MNDNWERGKIMLTPINFYMENMMLHYTHYLKEKIKDLDVSHGDLIYMFLIFYHSPLSQKELADLLYFSEAGITRKLNKLEENGLVIRDTDPTSRNKNIITLSKKGEETFAKIMEYSIEWEMKVIELSDIENYEKFKELLYQASKKSLRLTKEKE